MSKLNENGHNVGKKKMMGMMTIGDLHTAVLIKVVGVRRSNADDLADGIDDTTKARGNNNDHSADRNGKVGR